MAIRTSEFEQSLQAGILEKAEQVEVDGVPPQLAGEESWWHTISGFQKALRRGLPITTDLADALLAADQERFLRRLIVIGLEDIGPAAPREVAELIFACSRPGWMAKTPYGVRGIILALVEGLRLGPKTRLACELGALVAHDPALRETRSKMFNMLESKLVDLVVHPDLTLQERVLACWALVGTAAIPHRLMPEGLPGSPRLLVNAVAARAPELQSWLVKAGFARQREHHPVGYAAALLHGLHGLKGGEFPVTEMTVGESTSLGDLTGVPLEGYDRHTRTGKIATRWWLNKLNPDLKAWVSKRLPAEADPAVAVDMVVFWTEGRYVTPEAKLTGFEAVTEQARKAALRKVGFPDHEHTAAILMIGAQREGLAEARRIVAKARKTHTPLVWPA